MLSNSTRRAPTGRVGRILQKILLALAIAAGVALFLIYIMPFLWILIISFKPLALIKVPPREALLFTPTVDNYVRLYTEWGFFDNVRNSLIISGGTTLLNLAVGLFAAFALVRYRLTGGNFVAVWILSQRFLPVVAIMLPMFLFYQRFNLENTYHGLIIANTVATLPFTVWLLRGFLAELPPELYDAAEVDGCGEMGVVRHIVFPLSRPALGVTGVFSFLFSWNEFMIPLTLARPETATVTLGFAAFRQQFRTDWGAAAAATIVTIIPLYIVIALLQENIIRGLSMGAVKG